jgi:isopentenyl phosphate kinase
MKDLVVIKFGGSSITKKEENKFEMNYELLNRAAGELARAIRSKNLQAVLICGVGPFGHSNVKKYDINDGIRTEKHLEGVKKTNSDCDFVAREVAKALAKQGLKTRHIPGYDVCVQKAKKVESFDFKTYREALSQGFIPITTGVMVKDTLLNWSVMSGDAAIAQLARHLKPKMVLMGTDVDGIFTSDPKADKKAELIEKITKENVSQILAKVGKSKSVDVTGGMKGKLEKLAQQLSGVPAEIFNLFTAGNLENALEGKEIRCTKVRL